MMNAAESESDMDVSFSDTDSKLENESLRRTSRIRYCSRKKLEAQALLKDKPKMTKSESTHTQNNMEGSSLISRRRSLDDLAINMNEVDSVKKLHVTNVKENKIIESNSIEHLVIAKTKVECRPSKSKVKRSNSLDSDTSKIKISNFDSHNEIVTDTSCLDKGENNREGNEEKSIKSLQMLNKIVQKSFKRKMETEQINIQKIRKKLKTNKNIKTMKLSKTLKSDDNSDGKGKREMLRSLRMKNDCNVAENELLDLIAISMNNEINDKVETEKKKAKKKSKVSVSQIKLDKIKLMNVKRSVIKEINSEPPMKVRKNYKKSVKAKKIGPSSILKKKFRTYHNVTSSNKKTKQISVITSTQNAVENPNQEDSCRSIIVTDFSSLLSKYGAIKLSATKKKLGIVPNSFLNLELVTAAINCQYFGFQEVFDWISKCLKLKNVSLTQTVEKQFKLFEQIFNHMGKSIMTDADEEEWSKLRIKYYNLPVHSQSSWELVFGYTPKFCNYINLDSSSRKTTSDLQEESNKESFDVSLNGFRMLNTEKKYRPNRKAKADNTVVSTKLNNKDNLKTKIPVVKTLNDDIVVSTELSTTDNLKTKIPMVKIYGFIPEVGTKTPTTEPNCIAIELKNYCSSKIKNKSNRTSCFKNIDNRGKPVLEKLWHKDKNKKTKGKKIQLKETLWNSKKKMDEKINKKGEIEAKEYLKITHEVKTQDEKRKFIETSVNPEIKAEIIDQNSIKLEPYEDTIANNDFGKEDCTSYKKLGRKASQNINLQPRKIIKEKSLEKSSNKGCNENKVEELSLSHRSPISKETVQIDDSHFSNIQEIDLPQNDKCNNKKLDKELYKDKIKEIECNNVNVQSNEKILSKPIQSRKIHIEKSFEKNSKKGSIANKVEKLPQTRQLHIVKETVKTGDPQYSNIKEIDLPTKGKCKNRKIDKELTKEKVKEMESNIISVDSNEKSLQSLPISSRKTQKEKCLEKKSEKVSLKNKVEKLPQTHQLHISKETVDPHVSNMIKIDLKKKGKFKDKIIDKELSQEKFKEVECENVNVDSHERILQPTPIYLRKIFNKKCPEGKSEKGSINNKVEKLPKTHESAFNQETVEIDDPCFSNIKEMDIPKVNKFKDRKIDEELSKVEIKEIKCKEVNIVSNEKGLLPRSIYLRKIHEEICLEEKSEKGNIDIKVEKLPQTDELAFSIEKVKTNDSQFSNIKEIDLPEKKNCENKKLDKELSKESEKEIQCNNANVECNENNMNILNKNTVNDRPILKKYVKHIVTKNSSSEKPQSYTQKQVIPTLVNYFRRKNITNIDSVFETLQLIHMVVTHVFCEKNILNLSKDFLQKDNHDDGSYIHDKEDVLDLTNSNNTYPFEACERHFTRLVSIVKADEMETSKNIDFIKKLTSVSSIDLNKTVSTIDPKPSVISQCHESLHITISDHESQQKTSEIISHESPKKKIYESCNCCKSVCDIKFKLEKLFCNSIEYEECLDGDQNKNVQGKSSKEEIEILFETSKNNSIDNCIQQNVFLKQNLYQLKKTHKKDFEKLTENYVFELEKRRNKCTEDTDRLQGQIEVLERLNEFFLIEKENELEKQSKNLREEHKQELEKINVGHSAQLKNIETSETYICELETQKENLKEQNSKLEEDSIRLKTQVRDLEKLNESILIDKNKELENLNRKLTEEHNKELDKQRERHITQLKRLEEHKKHLKGQLNEKNIILSRKIPTKKYHTSDIASSTNSLKRTNFDDYQRVTKFSKSESEVEYQSIDTCKGKILLKEKLENLTSYRPESSCDIVAKIAKHSDNRFNVKSQISSLNEEQKNNPGNLTSIAPFTMNYNSFGISPSTPLTPQPFQCTSEVVDLSPSKGIFSISSEKKKINVEEYRLRNFKKHSNDIEEYSKCSIFISLDTSLDPDYSENKIFEESFQEHDDNENLCKMCEEYKKENEGYKKECEKYQKELEELTCELQEFRKNKTEKENDVNTMKADMYNRYHVMKSSFEDANKSMKSNIEDLMKSNQQLKEEKENLKNNYDVMKYEKNEKGKLYDDFKESNEKKHIECEITKENLRKQCEQRQYESKLLKKEMEKLNIDLGNSKFKLTAEQNRYKKEIDLKEIYINQLQKENVKKDEILIDKEISVQRLTLIEKRYLELIKYKQMCTENFEDVCKNSEKLGEIKKKITKKDGHMDESETTNKDCIEELIIVSPEEDAQNGNADNVRKKFKQLEKNSATNNEKIKQMSFQLNQNKKEQSKVKLLETKKKNLQKQQLGCAINHKNHLEDIDKNKIKGQQKSVKLYESLRIDRKVSVKVRGSIRTRIKDKSNMQLKIDEQKQEIIMLSDSFEKEKEAAEYYGKHLWYQRSRNVLLEERLCASYRDNLRELSLQMCQFDGAAERYRSIMNDLTDLTKTQEHCDDPTTNHENSGNLAVKEECLDLSGSNSLPEITIIEKQLLDLERDKVQEMLLQFFRRRWQP